MSSRDFKPGTLESTKFDDLREPYYKGLDVIKSLNYTAEDYIHYFPCFSGHQTLARYLTVYDCYKQTLGVAGHVAEIGVYKGACSILLAKLLSLYEPSTLTQVHGFDWFKGAAKFTEKESDFLIEGSYQEPKDRLQALVEAQNLSSILKLHDLDMSSSEVEKFFNNYSHLQFKLVFFDAGTYKVVKNSLPYFWERLIPGGMIVFDQFNFDIAPGETQAVMEILSGEKIRTFPNGWMPNAYVIKS